MARRTLALASAELATCTHPCTEWHAAAAGGNTKDSPECVTAAPLAVLRFLHAVKLGPVPAWPPGNAPSS